MQAGILVNLGRKTERYKQGIREYRKIFYWMMLSGIMKDLHTVLYTVGILDI